MVTRSYQEADYLRKFTEELSNKENEGKSDADIFKSLTENDGAAFKVPSAQNVFGGADGIKGGVGWKQLQGL